MLSVFLMLRRFAVQCHDQAPGFSHAYEDICSWIGYSNSTLCVSLNHFATPLLLMCAGSLLAILQSCTPKNISLFQLSVYGHCYFYANNLATHLRCLSCCTMHWIANITYFPLSINHGLIKIDVQLYIFHIYSQSFCPPCKAVHG